MGKRKFLWCLMITTGCLFLTVHCTIRIPNIIPPPNVASLSMKTEYQNWLDADLLKDSTVAKAIRDAFKQAKTDISFFQSFVRIDTLTFVDDVLFYQAYRDSFKTDKTNATYPYYLVSAQKLNVNAGGGFGIKAGVSFVPGPNSPPFGNQRWSFVFYKDILANDALLPGEFWRYLAQVTIHELGHQRSGLTHANLDEVNCSVAVVNHDDGGSGAKCVMNFGACITDAPFGVLQTLSFCNNKDTTKTNNCVYKLKHQF